jgi:hypothetical protein
MHVMQLTFALKATTTNRSNVDADAMHVAEMSFCDSKETPTDRVPASSQRVGLCGRLPMPVPGQLASS